jgi:hypothetical protein
MIRIIPFRERVLSSPGFELTSQGKEMAKSYVRSQTLKQPDGKPDPSLFSNTNICGAFTEAMNQVNTNHETVIYLYTDGEQNMPYDGHGSDCLRNIIYLYCNKFGGSDVFTFLISLNNSLSRVNLDLSKACDNIRIFNIEEGRSIANISFIKIKPSLPLLHFNPARKKNANRQIFKADGGKIPADFRYDAILNIENTGYNIALRDFKNLTIENSGTTFQVLFGTKPLPARMHGKIKLVNPRSSSNAIIHFQPDEFNIEISTVEPPRVTIIGFEPATK